MSFQISAIMPQIAFAQRIRDFARAMARRVLPGVPLDELQFESNQIFETHLNSAIYSLPEGASDRDRRCAVVKVICKDATRLCAMLKNACKAVGLGDIADEYLNHATFFNFVLEQDNAKMDLLMSIAENSDEDLARVFFNIARVLKGKEIDYYKLGDDAKRKASDDIKNLAAEVRDHIERVGAKVERVGAKVERVGAKVEECKTAIDSLDEKVSKLRKSEKPRGRYTQKSKTLCWSCWTAAAHREEVWGNLNTRITYKAVFDYYRSRLAQVGVLDHNMFREIIRAECRRRNRELENRADKAR